MNKKIVIVVLIALLIACVTPADTADADPGWDWYREITINKSKVISALNYDGQISNFTEGDTITGGTSGATATIDQDEDQGTSGTLFVYAVTGTFQDDETITDEHTGSATANGTLTTPSNFPVLISLSGVWLRHTAYTDGHVGQTDGGDIVFTDSTNSVKYDHEIERYYEGANDEDGVLVAWVEIPTLSSTTDTIIRIWYGNAAADDQWNTEAVWDSNHMGVWHLKETSGGAGAIKDSTSNNNDGTDNNSPTLGATGKIGNAVSFSTGNDHISISSFDPPHVGTVTFWLNPSSPGGSRERILGGHNAWEAPLEGTAKLESNFFIAAGSTETDTTLSAGNWYYASFTYNYSTNSTKVYVNGGLEVNISDADDDPGGPFDVGLGMRITQSSEYYHGLLDEVRFSNIARGGEWIKTSYNNQSDATVGASYFLKSLGSEQDVSGGADPVPELPTIILMSLGLVGLGIYLWLRRRRLVYVR